METMKLTCRIQSPLGEILLVATAPGDALCGLYLARQKYFPDDAARWTESRALAAVPQRSRAVARVFRRRAHRIRLAARTRGDRVPARRVVRDRGGSVRCRRSRTASSPAAADARRRSGLRARRRAAIR